MARMGLKTLLVNNMLAAARGATVTTFQTRVALHTDAPTQVNELTAAGYSGEQTVAAGGWTVDTSGGKRRMRNTAKISFGDPTGAWDPDYVGIWNGAPGASNLLAEVAVTPGMITATTTEVFIGPNVLNIQLDVD